MKHLVVQSDLKSADIRPPALLDSWLVLAERASRDLLVDEGALESVPCPACDEMRSEFAFERLGFRYERCERCSSLYVRKRPTRAALERHYSESEAAAFRLQYFAEQTASARFKHIIQSRVDWIGQVLVRQFKQGALRFADIGTLYPGLFSELREAGDFSALASLGTDPRVAATLPSYVAGDEDAGPFELISAFEQLEHQFSPFEQLVRLRGRLSSAGILLLTTRSGSGFDMTILGGRARYVFVPEHLNLLSLAGLTMLMDRTGFEVVELSTPGELDVGLVRDTVLREPDIALPSFVRALLFDRPEQAHRDFQEFLQKHRLSSHVRLAARRID